MCISLKAICDIPTTRDLVERLKVDRQMRNLCGWVLIHEIPSESTFSRAFAEFAESDLPGRMHKPKFSSWGKEVLCQVVDVDPITVLGNFKNG